MNSVEKDDFWKYTVKLKALKIEYRVLSDFDFFKSGLGNYLLKNNLVSIKDRHNELNSKISGINKNCECLEELNGDKSLQKSVEEFIDELYTYGLFVHKCGELEDTYTDESKEYLTKNSLGGNKKEQAALALVILIVSKQKEVADLIKIEFYKPLFDEITSYLTSQQSVIEKKSQSEESVLTTPSETNDSSQKIPF